MTPRSLGKRDSWTGNTLSMETTTHSNQKQVTHHKPDHQNHKERAGRKPQGIASIEPHISDLASALSHKKLFSIAKMI